MRELLKQESSLCVAGISHSDEEAADEAIPFATTTQEVIFFVGSVVISFACNLAIIACCIACNSNAFNNKLD